MASTSPTSDLYEVKETPSSGRGVFATKLILAGTPLMSTDLLPAHVVYRGYKREVCAYCFAYESSRHLKLKIVETGHAFCTKECMRAFKADAGAVGLEAWAVVEIFVKGNGKGSNERDGDKFAVLPDEGAKRPDVEQITLAWQEADETVALVRKARNGSKSKPHQKALQSVLSQQMYSNTLSFLLSGVLMLAKTETQEENRDWQAVLELVADSTPYTSPLDLTKNIRSYLQLTAILSLDLLTHLTPHNCLTLVSRDSHNSFGIRSLDDNGSEMFGYGAWPLASYWNHSCEPSVQKKRVGRAWEFWTEHDIQVGEELCISYMGGDEAELDVIERRGRSQDIWGFECACTKCMRDEEELEGTSDGTASS
jgi:SET and MYND domain-containing protein